MTLKVCHVISTLDVGGIERWLSNVAVQMRVTHGNEVQFDFLTLFGKGGRLAYDLEKLGCGVSAITFTWKNILSTVRKLCVYFRNGHYDVVHCHADYLGGVVLLAAKLVGVPLKINHIHTTSFLFDETNRPLRWLVGRLLRQSCLCCADLQIGCSQASLDAFIGRKNTNHSTLVHYCSIPLDPFRKAITVNRQEVKKRLGIDLNKSVIIHIGRHSEPKNLFYMLDVLRTLQEMNDDILLLLAGSGTLTGKLQEIVKEGNLERRIIFLGDRNDVPMLLRAADLMILPSLYEGLPVAVVEAQAAGVSCLISDSITKEVDIVPELVERFPLSAGVEKWAEQLKKKLKTVDNNRSRSLEIVAASPFDLEKGCSLLLSLYKKGLERVAGAQ